MGSPIDIEWRGLKHARPFRRLILQSPIERITIQRFPNPQSFAYWRVFIELKLKWLGTSMFLELNTNLHRLTCERIKQRPISGERQLILPAPENNPHQVTVERVLEIATSFRRTLYVTSRMTEQQFQSEWALWVVKLAMELGESEPIAANPTVLYDFRDRVVKEALAPK